MEEEPCSHRVFTHRLRANDPGLGKLPSRLLQPQCSPDPIKEITTDTSRAGLCIVPHHHLPECPPARHKQPRSWPYTTPSPDPGADSTAGAQCRMTSRQISHGLPPLVLLLLLIKARLVGISRTLCRGSLALSACKRLV